MTTIKLKNGSGAPAASDLVQGEPALDLTNKRLYTENASGTVIEVGTNPTSLTTGTFTSTGIDDNATSTAITIDSSGRVSIGTTSATELLNIAAGSSTGAGVEFAGNGNTVGSTSAFYGQGSGSDAYVWNRANSTVLFGTNNTERMRIDSSGRVSIGATSTTKNFLVENPSTASGEDVSFRIKTNGTGSSADAIFEMIASTTGECLINFGDSNDANIGNIRYDHNINAMRFITNTNEAVRINSSGQVGIGTTNPSVYGKTALVQTTNASTGGLAIVDSTAAQSAKLWCDTTNAYLSSGNTGADPLILNAGGGNVGIGTTSPQFQLHLSGSAPGVVMSETAAAKYYRNRAAASALTWDILNTDFSFNSEAMRIDSSGNLLVNSTSAGALASSGRGLIDVDGTSDSAIELKAGGSTYGYLYASSSQFRVANLTANPVTFFTSNTERMRIDGSGNVGIGTATPTSSSGWAKFINIGGTDTNALILDGTESQQAAVGAVDGLYLDCVGSSTASKNKIIFRTQSANSNYNGSERMRIDSSGNLLVGTTSTYSTSPKVAIGIQSTGTGLEMHNSGGTGWTAIRFHTGATLAGYISVGTTTTTYNTSSDQRLKENIVDAPAGNIDDIRVRSFDWKADGSHQTYGMVAQELVDVAPEAVTQGETEDDMWAVDYSKLVPMMIKEIQDLKAEVAALKGE
jgi:hypothetical protein